VNAAVRAPSREVASRGVSHFLWLDEGPARQPFSGVENHLAVLLPALARRGFDVELMVFAPRRGPAIDRWLRMLEEQDVRVALLPTPERRRWRYLRRRAPQYVMALVPEFARRRDRILHLHLDFKLSPLAARLARCPRVVMSLHNDELWFDRPLARRWLRWLDGGIGHYIAISDRVAAYYRATVGVRKDKFSRIYYGLELAPPAASRAELRRRHAIPVDRFVVGFVGRLTAQKNLDRLLDAVAQAPEVHLVLVGEGEQGDALRQRAAALRNVQFLGYQPDGAELISAFDAFCLPSVFEGLGLVLVEAMQQRVPVIASRAGAIPEVLGDGRYGRLVDPCSTDELVAALREAAREGAPREQVDAACAYARARFSVPNMVEETVAVYARLG
jgi:glycosyltransferase involved in cell wall biosynthesis